MTVSSPASSTFSPFVRPQRTCAPTYTQVNERPKVTNRHLYMLFAVILTFAFTAGTARADYKTGNPTKCGLTSRQDCARNAAIWTLRGVMAKRLGRPPYNWTAAVTCTQAAAPSLLKWRCSFGTGTAFIWFRPLSTGWKRVVTVTMNP